MALEMCTRPLVRSQATTGNESKSRVARFVVHLSRPMVDMCKYIHNTIYTRRAAHIRVSPIHIHTSLLDALDGAMAWDSEYYTLPIREHICVSITGMALATTTTKKKKERKTAD